MKPAARITDMHTCPMVTGLVPHVGGPIITGATTVLIGFLPAARVTDMCTCVGPPDMIVMGSPTVFTEMMMQARIGDPTVHGGIIVTGEPTVLVGEAGGGGAGGLASPAPVVDALKGAASNGTGLVQSSVPAAGAAAPAAALVTGLGKDVDALAAKSPTLVKNLED